MSENLIGRHATYSTWLPAPVHDLEPDDLGDVELTEGQRVTVVEVSDSPWVHVLAAGGEVVLAPLTQLELDVEGPPPTGIGLNAAGHVLWESNSTGFPGSAYERQLIALILCATPDQRSLLARVHPDYVAAVCLAAHGDAGRAMLRARAEL